MDGNIFVFFKWFFILIAYFLWSFGRIAVHNSRVDELECSTAWESMKE